MSKLLKETLYAFHLSLAYENNGNYTKFVDIASRTNLYDSKCNKYFPYNLLLAMAVQGIIDIAWTDAGIKWVANPTLKSDSNECIVFAKDIYSNEIRPSAEIEGKPVGYSFNRNRDRLISLERYCNIGEIVDRSLDKDVAVSSEFESEYFSFESIKWKICSTFTDQSCLLRFRHPYDGMRYFLHIKETDELYQFRQIEWLFIISYFLLNIDPNIYVRRKANNLEIHPAFRLPIVLYRLIFQSSGSFSLGNRFVFKDFRRDSSSKQLKSLMPGIIV